MIDRIIIFFSNIKEYFKYFIFGDKDEIILKEIYKENDIDIEKVYKQLYDINHLVAKEKDYNKILYYIKREIKYEKELKNYENILDLELETSDKVKKIELMTMLCELKKSFEKIINIKQEYFKTQNDKKDL